MFKLLEFLLNKGRSHPINNTFIKPKPDSKAGVPFVLNVDGANILLANTAKEVQQC